MGSIFGNDGSSIFHVGNTTFSNDRTGTDATTRSGNTLFSQDGDSMYDMGDTAFMNNGDSIQKVGDAYFCNGTTYTKVGNALFSSDGRQWSGIGGLSDSDIKNIIFNDNR